MYSEMTKPHTFYIEIIAQGNITLQHNLALANLLIRECVQSAKRTRDNESWSLFPVGNIRKTSSGQDPSLV